MPLVTTVAAFWPIPLTTTAMSADSPLLRWDLRFLIIFFGHKFTLVLIGIRWRIARRTRRRVPGQTSMHWDAVTTLCIHRRRRVRAIAQPSTQCTESLRRRGHRRFHLAPGLRPTTAPSRPSSVLFTLRPQILTASPDSPTTRGSVH